MTKVTRTVAIKAPAQRVYDFLTQPSNLPSIWANMHSVSNAVASVKGGYDFDWEYAMAGLKFRGRSRTEETQPGKLYRVRNEGGIPSTFVWTFEGLDGAGTRLRVDVEYTIPARVIGKIAEALVAKLNERDLDTMLAHLKDRMESAASAAAAHPR